MNKPNIEINCKICKKKGEKKHFYKDNFYKYILLYPDYVILQFSSAFLPFRLQLFLSHPEASNYWYFTSQFQEKLMVQWDS